MYITRWRWFIWCTVPFKVYTICICIISNCLKKVRYLNEQKFSVKVYVELKCIFTIITGRLHIVMFTGIRRLYNITLTRPTRRLHIVTFTGTRRLSHCHVYWDTSSSHCHVYWDTSSLHCHVYRDRLYVLPFSAKFRIPLKGYT